MMHGPANIKFCILECRISFEGLCDLWWLVHLELICFTMCVKIDKVPYFDLANQESALFLRVVLK